MSIDIENIVRIKGKCYFCDMKKESESLGENMLIFEGWYHLKRYHKPEFNGDVVPEALICPMCARKYISDEILNLWESLVGVE